MAVYDCFTFYNEYDMLEFRLKMLYNVVDYFVIVELDMTHRGKKKEFNLAAHMDRYSEFLKKIIYIKEKSIVSYDASKMWTINGHENGDWSVENYQRNAIIHGLKKCAPNDIIIISDLDEIPRPEIIKNLGDVFVEPLGKRNIDFHSKLTMLARMISLKPKTFYKKRTAREMLDITPIVLEEDCYWYFMNLKDKQEGYGPVISLYEKMAMPQVMRDWRWRLPVIRNASWHFSYIGGIEMIKSKLNSIVDGASNIAEQDEYIEKCISEGKWLFDEEKKLEFIEKEKIGNPLIEWFYKQHPDYFHELVK